MARADRGVALEVDAPLLMENVDTRLLEVGVNLDLVDSGPDAASSDKVCELGHHAVADTD